MHPARPDTALARRPNRRASYDRSTAEMATAWLDQMSRDLRPASVLNYRGHLDRFAAWLAIERAITTTAAIGPSELRVYGELWRQREQSGAYKASTVNNHLNPVRRWLRWMIAEAAVFDRAPDTNEPWVTAERVNEWLSDVQDTSRPTRKQRALSAAEVTQLLAVIPAPRDHALFALLAGSGLRVSELCALRAGDFEIRPDGAGVVHVLDGKGGKRRAVVVAESVVGHIHAWAIAAGFRPGDPTDTRSLWPTRQGEGRSLTRVRVYQLLQAYAAAAKIPHKVSPHNLRHTYGTERYRAERDPLAVANALGHAGLAYVQTYVKEVETGEAQPFRPDWE